MPYFHTSLEISDIDSLLLIKYNKEEIKDSAKVCLKYKFIDKGSITKWRFMLCDSFEVGYNYKLKIVSENIVYSYDFNQIIYDTVKSYNGYRYDTKSYYLNGVKYSKHYCDYTLQ